MIESEKTNRLFELEHAPVGKLLWKYSLPAIVGVVVMSLYNIVDRIFRIGGHVPCHELVHRPWNADWSRLCRSHLNRSRTRQQAHGIQDFRKQHRHDSHPWNMLHVDIRHFHGRHLKAFRSK